MTKKRNNKQCRIAPPPPADAPLKKKIHPNAETTRDIIAPLDAALTEAEAGLAHETTIYRNDINAAITALHRARENYFDPQWESKQKGAKQ